MINASAISFKLTVDTAAGKAAIDDFNKTLKKTGDEAAQTGTELKKTADESDRFAKSGTTAWGNMSGALGTARTALGAIGITVSALKVVEFFHDSFNASQSLQTSMLGLSSVAKNLGVSVDDAKRAAIGLTRDGMLNLNDASKGLQNLLASGMGLPQATQLMEKSKDAAIFNRQAHLGLSESIRVFTEGIKSQLSTLTDATGAGKNYDAVLKDTSKSIKAGTFDFDKYGTGLSKVDIATIKLAVSHTKNYQELDKVTKAMIVGAGFLQEYAMFEGNAANGADLLTVKMAKLDQKMFELKAKIGDALVPAVSTLVSEFSKLVDETQKAGEETGSMGSIFHQLSWKIASPIIEIYNIRRALSHFMEGVWETSVALMKFGATIAALTNPTMLPWFLNGLVNAQEYLDKAKESTANWDQKLDDLFANLDKGKDKTIPGMSAAINTNVMANRVAEEASKNWAESNIKLDTGMKMFSGVTLPAVVAGTKKLTDGNNAGALSDEERKKALDKVNKAAEERVKALEREWEVQDKMGKQFYGFIAPYLELERLAFVKREEAAQQAIATMEEEIEKEKALTKATGDFIVKAGEASKAATDKSFALTEGQKKLNEYRNELTNVNKELEELRKAGATSTEIVDIMGKRLIDAAEYAEKYGISIDEATKELIKLAETEEDAKKWGEAWKNQISTVFTDLSKGIADAVVEWKGFGDTLISITQDFIKAMLRLFVEGLMGNIMKMFKSGDFSFGGLFEGMMPTGKGGILDKAKSALGIGTTAAGIGGGVALGGSGTALAIGSGQGLFAAGGVLSGGTGSILAPAGGGGMFAGIQGALAAVPVWGWVAAAAITAGVIFWKAFNKSVSEKAAAEGMRDFGVALGANDFKSFTRALGLSEKDSKGIRKDIESSPKFLVEVMAPLAIAQGNLDTFLKSLEKVQTSWGDFNFREAFEVGQATGDWSMLNKQFVEAFGNSKELERVLPGWKESLMATSSAAEGTGKEFLATVKKMKEMTDAYDVFKNRPKELTANLKALEAGLAAVSLKGASDSDIMEMFGEEIGKAAEQAASLGVELPEVIKRLYELGLTTVATEKAARLARETIFKMEEAFISMRGASERGDIALNTFAAGIQAVEKRGASAEEMIALFGEDINAFAEASIKAGKAMPEWLANLVKLKDNLESAELATRRTNDTLDKMRGSFNDLRNRPKEMGIEIANFTLGIEALQREGITAAEVLELFGDQAMEMARAAHAAGMDLPEWIKNIAILREQQLEAAAAMNEASEAADKQAKSIFELTGVYAQFGQFTSDTFNNAIKNVLALDATLNATGADMLRFMSIPQAQQAGWDLFGKSIVDTANSLRALGIDVLPPSIAAALEWAKSLGFITQAADGTWRMMDKAAESTKKFRDQLHNPNMMQDTNAQPNNITTQPTVDQMNDPWWRFTHPNFDPLYPQYPDGKPKPPPPPVVADIGPTDRDPDPKERRAVKTGRVATSENASVIMVFEGDVYGVDDFDARVSEAFQRNRTRTGV